LGGARPSFFKDEFGKFWDTDRANPEKIGEANFRQLDKVGRSRTRAISRKLKDVEENARATKSNRINLIE